MSIAVARRAALRARSVGRGRGVALRSCGPRCAAASSDPPLGVLFRSSGYHVLRSGTGESFAAFRCGSVRDRFSQIDMLHLDVWWRGQNVLVDPRQLSLQRPEEVARPLLRDGLAQHRDGGRRGPDGPPPPVQEPATGPRRSSCASRPVPANGSLRRASTTATSEPHPAALHRRAVLMAGDDLWIVLDRCSANGSTSTSDCSGWVPGRLGPTSPSVRHVWSSRRPRDHSRWRSSIRTQQPLAGDVVAGQDGTTARVAVPVLRREGTRRRRWSSMRQRALPCAVISVLGAGGPQVIR